jgi:hypothetical protein
VRLCAFLVVAALWTPLEAQRLEPSCLATEKLSIARRVVRATKTIWRRSSDCLQ